MRGIWVGAKERKRVGESLRVCVSWVYWAVCVHMSYVCVCTHSVHPDTEGVRSSLVLD